MSSVSSINTCDGAITLASSVPGILGVSNNPTAPYTITLAPINANVGSLNGKLGAVVLASPDNSLAFTPTALGSTINVSGYVPTGSGGAGSALLQAQNLSGALAWAGGGSPVVSTVVYNPGALVIYSGTTYVCRVAQPIGSVAPANGANWQSIGTGGSSSGTTWDLNGLNTANTSIGIVGQQVNPFDTDPSTGGFKVFDANAYSFINNFAPLGGVGKLEDPNNSTNFGTVGLRTTYTGSFTMTTIPNISNIPNWLYILAYGTHPSIPSSYITTPIVAGSPAQLCKILNGTMTRISPTSATPINITPLSSGSPGTPTQQPNNYVSYPADVWGVFWDTPPAVNVPTITSVAVPSVVGYTGLVSQSPCIGECDISADNPQVGDVYSYSITVAWYLYNN